MYPQVNDRVDCAVRRPGFRCRRGWPLPQIDGIAGAENIAATLGLVARAELEKQDVQSVRSGTLTSAERLIRAQFYR
jgi:hypothetical protein